MACSPTTLAGYGACSPRCFRPRLNAPQCSPEATLERWDRRTPHCLIDLLVWPQCGYAYTRHPKECRCWPLGSNELFCTIGFGGGNVEGIHTGKSSAPCFLIGLRHERR